MSGRAMRAGAASSVVVFGATSYLGQYVLSDLLRRGHRVIAVTRNPELSSILLRPFDGRITVARSSDLQAGGEAVAALVNLAYVKTEKPHRLMRQNAQLVRSIHDTAVRVGARRLVHASTMAVFGYEFDDAPKPVRAGRRFGDPYIESKLSAEHHLERLQPRGSYALAMVRLGNIVGPGSPVWVANLAQRMLEGRPVGVAGRDGYSNAALAANIASYIGHLVGQEPATLGAFGRFHHLAELSATRWSCFVDAFADCLGVAPIRIGRVPGRASPGGRALLAGMVKSAYGGNAGGYARTLFGALPMDGIVERLLSSAKTALVGGALSVSGFAGPADRDILTILSSAHEFRSHTLPGWTPPVSLTEAIRGMVQSLREGGFAQPAPALSERELAAV
jgi:dTDP-4-dehydrorhamnose reductase